MGKVNKRGAVTAKRRAKAKRAPNGASAATRPKGRRRSREAAPHGPKRKGTAPKLATKRDTKRVAKKSRSGSVERSNASKRTGKLDRHEREVPVVTYRIRGLDPLAKCGPSTSVQVLYRVDESVDGAQRPHLVFLDRHGWYCEHGRDCPAVGYARKHDDGVARESKRT